jgi:antitoxin HicB
MATYTYPVRMRPDDNGTQHVSFPDFPETHTFGATRDEALARAVDALATAIDAYVADRRDIPTPSRGRTRVTLPALTASKVALYELMRAQRVGKAELARRLRCHLPQVDRLLQVHHASRLDQLEAAFKVLGKELRIVIDDR